MNDSSELGDFLRAMRERLDPADFGFPATARRRTPGLRREEVATLAGVSVDYLVRLEQGRDRNPSPQVMAALSDALRLTVDERTYLARLALSESDAFCPFQEVVARTLTPTIQQILTRLEPSPAFVLDAYTDVLGHNESWRELVQPLGLLDEEIPNLARFTFVHPAARAVYPDWDAIADHHVSRLRAATMKPAREDRHEALIAEMLELPEFARRWPRHEVTEPGHGVKRIVHPDAGELRLAYEALALPVEHGNRQLVVWLPADEATARALDAVLGNAAVSPARLRVVGDES